MNVLTNSPEGFAVLGIGWGALTALLNILANFKAGDLMGSVKDIAGSWAPVALLAAGGSALYLGAKDSLPEVLSNPLKVGRQYTRRFFTGVDGLQEMKEEAQTTIANTLAEQFRSHPEQTTLLQSENMQGQSFFELIRDMQIEAKSTNKPFTIDQVKNHPSLTEDQKKLLKIVIANAKGDTDAEKSISALNDLNLIVYASREIGIQKKTSFKQLVVNFAVAERAREAGEFAEDKRDLEAKAKQAANPAAKALPGLGDLFTRAMKGALETDKKPE
jgi:hypothetical protein